MDFSLTEDQQSFQTLAAQFSENHLAPHALHWDAHDIFPVDVLKEAGKLGFGALYIDPEYGGAGVSRLDGVLVFEALSKGCVSTAAYLSIHNMVGGLIQRFAHDEQKKRWLPGLADMSVLSSYCLTEPSSGSDAASLKTSAIREGDEYVLNGEKAFISAGGVSDLYLVMARTGGEGAQGISAVIVEKGTPGLSFGKPEKKMGWRSQPTTPVIFHDCRIPVENRLGNEGEGFKIAMTGLDGGRLNISACSLGGADFALSSALQYMQERQQFGKKLSDFQALQFRLADMKTSLEAARLMVYRAAWMVSTGHPEATQASAMAKLFATDAGFEIVNQALQLHGGYGYIRDYQIERCLRDVRVHQILEGTNEIMRLIIARKMLGR